MIPNMESRLQLPLQTRVVQAFPIPGGEPADAAAPRARPSRSLYDIVIHRRWLIVAFTAAVVGLVALWSYTSAPIYEATTVLQIDPERPRAVAFTGIPSELAPQEDIRFNERVFEAARQHPDRLLPFAFVNPALGQEAHDELDRRLGEARGVKLHVWFHGYRLTDALPILKGSMPLGHSFVQRNARPT